MKSARVVAAILLISPLARAGDADQCAVAYEHGQELRVEKKLGAAREQFLVCARPACPKVTRDDCSKWLGEVEATLPGVFIDARHGTTKIDDARVLVDGAVVSERIDTRAITLDPGKHMVRIEPRGCASHDREITLTGGEPIHVTFDVCGEATVVTSPLSAASKAPPLASIVLGGATLAALGTFIAFGAIGLSDANTLRRVCYPLCEQGRVDSANAELLAADISLGIAIVTLGVAAVVWLVAPRTQPKTLAWRF